jgi:hypothetical protein
MSKTLMRKLLFEVPLRLEVDFLGAANQSKPEANGHRFFKLKELWETVRSSV